MFAPRLSAGRCVFFHGDLFSQAFPLSLVRAIPVFSSPNSSIAHPPLFRSTVCSIVPFS